MKLRMLPRELVPDFVKILSYKFHAELTDSLLRVQRDLGFDQNRPLTEVDQLVGQELKDVLPSKSRAIDHLEFDENLLATKKRKGYRVQFQDDYPGDGNREPIPAYHVGEQPILLQQYYFKKRSVETDDGGVELEAYNAAICKFMAGNEYITSVRPYYGPDGYMGLSSRLMPEFKTNFEDPLQDEDIIITALSSEHLRNKIMGKVKDLCLEMTTKTTLSQKIHTCVSHLFYRREITQNYFCYQLELYISENEPFAVLSLEKLRVMVIARQHYIKEVNNDSHNKELELDQLSQLHEMVDTYLHLNDEQKQDILTIVEMDKIDRSLKAQGFNLDSVDFLPIPGRDNQYLRTSDLKHYRIVSGLAKTLTSRYIFSEGDGHNCNMAKTGAIVDLGLMKYNIAFHLTNQNIPAILLKTPNSDTFKCTARDIRCFPFLRDANPYFWPTKKTNISRVLLQSVVQYIQDHLLSGKSYHHLPLLETHH